jgi:hypothetical protein
VLLCFTAAAEQLPLRTYGTMDGLALETSLSDGMPKDDLYRCMGALRQGRSVVIAFTHKPQSTVAARDTMARAGAERLDAARQWRWFGPRPAKEKPDRAEA